MSPDEWLECVRVAKAGPELLDWIVHRITRPYDEGPSLDDRHGEAPEEVFERLAQEDEGFRARLDETAREYFGSEASDPSKEGSIPVIRGMFDLVQHRALTGASASIRAWLERHNEFIIAESGGYLARAALGALAISQPRGIADWRNFWLRLWRSGPSSWQPRAFIGLRLQDPSAAASEVPELIKRAQERNQDPAALLHGLWNQPDGRDAIIKWTHAYWNRVVIDAVYVALRQRVHERELQALNTTHKRRTDLPSLASTGERDWWAARG